MSAPLANPTRAAVCSREESSPRRGEKWTMDKDQVAAILAEIGTLLELQGENSFRCNAYHNGARAILQLEEDLGEVIRSGRLIEVPGIGETLREKITTLATTGKLPFYEDLKSQVPAG